MSTKERAKKTKVFLKGDSLEQFNIAARAPKQTVSNLSRTFNISPSTVYNHLHTLGLASNRGRVLVPVEAPVAKPVARIENSVAEDLIRLGQIIHEADALAATCGFKVSLIKVQ